MMRAKLGVLLGGLLAASVALAHGGGEHLMGTVKAINASTITLETKDKKVVTVHYDDQTVFEKSGGKATPQDLKVGARAVVHAMKHGELLHATLVKFGKPPRK